jgi:hypothetical protein
MARFIITGEYKDKATKLARKDLKGLTKDTQIFAKYAKKYYAIAAAAAVYYAQRVGRQSVTAALADEKSQRQLANTLVEVAGANDVAVISAEANIAAMSKMYGIADDQLRPAIAQLARITGNTNEAFNGLNLALSLSVATGKDLGAVTTAIGRAYNGNLTSLKRLNLRLDENKVKNKDINGIINDLRKTYGAFAAKELNTTANQINRIKVAAGEASEVIGVSLIQAISKLVGTQNGVNNLSKAFEDIAFYISDVVTGATELISIYNKLKTSINLAGSETAKQSKYNTSILGLVRLIGKEQRVNQTIQKSITNQVISARNAEMMALKAKKESVNATVEGTKKTVDQLIAEEAARKAGFKITEDIDSIQTVAAANRLKQISEEKNLYIQSLAEKLAAAKTNADAEALIWEAASKSSYELLQSLWAKGFQVPLTYVGGTAVGGFNASVPSPISNLVPEQGIPSFAGGTAAASGGSLALGGQTINVTVNAGAIGSEEFLVGEIGNALTKYTRLGNTTAPAGFM